MEKKRLTFHSRLRMPIFAGLCAALAVGMASAQTTRTLPDETETTTLTATVAEQATVTVPANVAFTVNDVTSPTVAAAANVTITNIVLATATKQLKVSLKAAAADFTPPVALAATWAPADVTWNASTWTGGIGASGTLDNVAFNEIATCTADTASCSTTGLVFTLGAKPAVKRSGDHTLSVTWKFEATGT